MKQHAPTGIKLHQKRREMEVSFTDDTKRSGQ
jgi:hypothetical protein